MKNIIMFFLLASVMITNAAQFEIVSDVKELTGDLTAQRFPVKDVNGQYCAILKIFTDIKDLQFKGFGYEKHDYKDGNYLVYMQPNSKNLTFMKDGFTTKPHNFPFKLQSNNVYGLELKGIGEEKKLENITINIIGEPENAVITFDGEQKGKISSLMTSVGKHELKVTKDGFQTYTKTIEVSPKKTMFKYNLAEVEDALVEIRSNPAGAAVYIDGIKLGETPLSNFYPPGTYKIKLTSDNYEDIEEDVVIKSPETKKTYQLTDIRATLTVNTHEKAAVYINGEQVTNYKNIKLSPQVVNIKVEMNKAETLEDRIILKKKDNKTVDMYPEISTGKIQIAVIPSDAEVEIWEDGGEKYTSSGSRSFKDVPVGNYNLKISKKGFKTHKEEIRLTTDEIEKKSIKLEEGADVGGDYIFVEGGTFQMGGTESDEKPVHSVTLSDFYIGKTEVTQAQWKSVMGNNPSSFKGDNNPVESVSWYDAVEFCNKLSEMEGLTKCYSGSGKGTKCNFNANGYRLPTEAEWEYAARGGSQSRGYTYSGSNDINNVAWYTKTTYDSGTKPVGTKKPNEIGIYDMSGNVYEWCWDWYDKNYYDSSPSSNPTGASSGSYRVLRGGSWNYYARYCRVANRNYNYPDYSYYNGGFRVVRLP